MGDWKLASGDASYFLTNVDYGFLDVMDPSGILRAEYKESINNIYNFMDELDTEFY